MGFAELNQEMKRYVDMPARRWLECVRVKRGRTDTGNPGAFAKEQSTWDGLVSLLYHRRSQSLNWLTLHDAKVSLEQYEAAAAAMEVENAALIIPHFLRPLNAYEQRLEQIALDNGLEAWLAPAKPPLSLRPPPPPLPSPIPPALPILAGGSSSSSA